MRRPIPFYAAPFVALAALLNAGCEDGPDQTYSPAPANAGNIWNGSPGQGGLGDGGAVVGTATENYDASFGGQNLNNICNAGQEKAIWTSLFAQNIAPPGIAGGIDITGGGYFMGPEGHCTAGGCVGADGFTSNSSFTYDATKVTWTGMTVEQAEAILCQSTPTPGLVFQGFTNSAGWGENLEFEVLYNLNSRQITDLILEPGYAGTLTAKATTTNGGNKVGDIWAMPFQNTPLTLNGAPVTLSWNKSDPAFIASINGWYNALLDQFAPNFPRDADCTNNAAGHCVLYIFPGQAGVNFPALNMNFYFPGPPDPTSITSTVSLLDLGLLKLMPFATAAELLKLDPTGPIASVPNISNSGTNCTYTLGETFKDFNAACVQSYPSSDPTQTSDNTIAENKLFGGMTHSDEAYSFDLAGLDPQFVAASLAPTNVVLDGQQPAATDVAYDFEIDTQDLGTVANDYPGNNPFDANGKQTITPDFHGMGLVTLEWAQLIQEYLGQYGVNTQIGDPDCLAAFGVYVSSTAAGNPAFGTVAGVTASGAPKVCSGLEGIVTSAPPADAATAPYNFPGNALGAAIQQSATISAIKPTLSMKPGSWTSAFCADAGGLDANGMPVGYTQCNGGGYFSTPRAIVDAAIIAQSGFNGAAVPPELTNSRFFFQEWVLALTKYFQVVTPAGASPVDASIATIDKIAIDPNNFFLDSAGAGFDSAQYVYRNSVNGPPVQAPTVLSLSAELNFDSISDYAFDRWNFRGETLLYSVLQADPTTALPKAGDQPGAEPLLLSNVVGSSVLTSLFGTGSAAYQGAVAAYTADATPANCSATNPCIDTDLTDYAPSFQQSALNIAGPSAAPSISPLVATTTGYGLIESAVISLPAWSKPYDPTSASPSDKNVQELLNFIPAGASVGFPVTIDGSREKFYNTNQTTITGVSFNGELNWEYVPAGSTNVVIRAFQSQNYLGQIFMCAEPSPTVAYQYDILAISMYEPAGTILNWLAAHPKAETDCQIIIQYSIYGNYADYIESNQYGIRLALNASYGGAVVTGATVFDPNVIATLGN